MDIDALLTRAAEPAPSGRAYGPVIERDDCVIIPAAYVLSVGGGGGGGGPTRADAPDAEAGSGGGAGHVSLSWPVGTYVIRNGEARWVPAFDATRVAVAAVVLVRLALKLRARRRARSDG